MAAQEPKEYGLILPSKNKNKVGGELGTRKLNPLLDSDDELDQDEESPLNWVEASLKKSAGNSGQQSLQKRLLREALEEDASVFQYDEVYDSMQAAKTGRQEAKDPAAKKPKYIHNLLKHAEKRKLEGERRNERKVQREREAEGEAFADKESFVTASYLKKMEELKKAEEEANIQEIKEEQVDVMKHKNFGVFYSHLFKQRMGEPVIKEEPKSEEEEEENTTDKQESKKVDMKRQKHYRTQRDLSESPERQEQRRAQPSQRGGSPSTSDSEAAEKVESYRDRRKRYDALEKDRESERERRASKPQTSDRRDRRERSRERYHGRERADQDRRYRGRQRSGSPDRRRRHSRSRSPASGRAGGSRADRRAHGASSVARPDSPGRPIKKERLTPNRDESEETRGGTSDRKDTKDKASDRKTSKGEDVKKEKEEEEVKVKKGKEGEVKVKKENTEEEKEKREERIQKLFTKRTVGEKFEEAVQRYYQRKAEREAQG